MEFEQGLESIAAVRESEGCWMITPEDLVQKQTLLDLQDVTFYEYCEIMNNGTGTPELNALGRQGRDEKIAHLSDMFGCSEELTRKAYELIYGK